MDELDKILQEQFLNKRVEVKIRSRDDKGKLINLKLNKFDLAGGLCTYIGKNNQLDIPLQINLNDHPIVVEHISHISLQPERKKITNIKTLG